MPLTLTEATWEELCQQAATKLPPTQQLDDFEIVDVVPGAIGCGYGRETELSPGLWLSFYQQDSHLDWNLAVPAHEHPIQMGVWLSGFIDFDAVHPRLGGARGYFSGSGISPAYVEKHRGGHHLAGVNLAGVNIELEAELLASFLAGGQYCAAVEKQLFKGEDWKVSFYPEVTPTIRALAQQMWQVPYRGVIGRVYLQAKAFELLALYLEAIASEHQQTPPRLKPSTVDCLHHAKDILTHHLENPPLISALAQQVGVSERTLQRGFRQLFGTTVVGYLKQQRLVQAEQLLRQGDRTVAAVAMAVGYGHLGHFAGDFKRQFGITPRDCLVGKQGTTGMGESGNYDQR